MQLIDLESQIRQQPIDDEIVSFPIEQVAQLRTFEDFLNLSRTSARNNDSKIY